jgi:hypothetical protein
MGVELSGVFSQYEWDSLFEILNYSDTDETSSVTNWSPDHNATIFRHNYQIGQTFLAKNIFLESITLSVYSANSTNMTGTLGAKIYEVNSLGFPTSVVIATSPTTIDASIIKGSAQPDFAFVYPKFNFNISNLVLNNTYAIIVYEIDPILKDPQSVPWDIYAAIYFEIDGIFPGTYNYGKNVTNINDGNGFVGVSGNPDLKFVITFNEKIALTNYLTGVPTCKLLNTTTVY